MWFIGNNLITGLCAGLIVAAYIFVRGFMQLRAQKKYWETHLGVISRGEEALKKQIEALGKENRTLQKNMDTLYRKPGRGDRRMLYIYEKAIAILMEEYPGFAGVWGRATRRAEKEMEEAEGGRSRLAPRLKKFLGLMPSTSSEPAGKNLFAEEAAELPRIAAKAQSSSPPPSREPGSGENGQSTEAKPSYTEGHFEEERREDLPKEEHPGAEG